MMAAHYCIASTIIPRAAATPATRPPLVLGDGEEDDDAPTRMAEITDDEDGEPTRVHARARAAVHFTPALVEVLSIPPRLAGAEEEELTTASPTLVAAPSPTARLLLAAGTAEPPRPDKAPSSVRLAANRMNDACGARRVSVGPLPNLALLEDPEEDEEDDYDLDPPNVPLLSLSRPAPVPSENGHVPSVRTFVRALAYFVAYALIAVLGWLVVQSKREWARARRRAALIVDAQNSR
jgi:hypothetical protein